MLIEIDYISLKLGYRTVNARKYVRCARTFYFNIFVHISKMENLTEVEQSAKRSGEAGPWHERDDLITN